MSCYQLIVTILQVPTKVSVSLEEELLDIIVIFNIVIQNSKQSLEIKLPSLYKVSFLNWLITNSDCNQSCDWWI